MVLSSQRVTPLVAHPLPKPDDLGGTPGHNGPTAARPAHYHRRFSERSALLSAAEGWHGLWRMRARLPPGPRLSAHTQGALSRGRMPAAPLAFCPGPPGWRPQLAAPMSHGSCRVHRPAAFSLALPPEASCQGPGGPVSPPGRPQFGAVRGEPSSRAQGARPSRLGAGSAQSGHGCDPVWPALAPRPLGR